MQVIGHDGERVNMPGAANRRLTKLFLKPIAINVVAHDVLTPITAGHDMMESRRGTEGVIVVACTPLQHARPRIARKLLFRSDPPPPPPPPPLDPPPPPPPPTPPPPGPPPPGPPPEPPPIAINVVAHDGDAHYRGP